jgi:hypothetical protein
MQVSCLFPPLFRQTATPQSNSYFVAAAIILTSLYRSFMVSGYSQHVHVLSVCPVCPGALCSPRNAFHFPPCLTINCTKFIPHRSLPLQEGASELPNGTGPSLHNGTGPMTHEQLIERSQALNVTTALSANLLLADAPIAYRHMTSPPILALSWVRLTSP